MVRIKKKFPEQIFLDLRIKLRIKHFIITFLLFIYKASWAQLLPQVLYELHQISTPWEKSFCKKIFFIFYFSEFHDPYKGSFINTVVAIRGVGEKFCDYIRTIERDYLTITKNVRSTMTSFTGDPLTLWVICFIPMPLSY